ncbi:RNA polymerase sigma factor [Deltaproteobacteria bacterium]|nr:RNA polymerase sigma factor [Deltaproteobacteria bacterium]
MPALRLALPEPERLVADHGGLVWALCRRLDPEPEDAWQEAWEKLLRALPRFDPGGTASVRTWLMTVVHRHLVDRHRRRTVRGDVLEADDVVDPGPGASARLGTAQDSAALERALALLPEPWRRVVVLHHLHEVPLERIAAEEGLPVGTVKSRLHRGRAALLEALT